jgi:septal ring factor EnvC (AmiA/AmiB activator)
MDADFEEMVSRSHAPEDGDAARLEARLSKMTRELESKSATAFARQESLDRLRRALELTWQEVDSLARDIARGEDALARMRARVAVEPLRPVKMWFVEDEEYALKREAA